MHLVPINVEMQAHKPIEFSSANLHSDSVQVRKTVKFSKKQTVLLSLLTPTYSRCVRTHSHILDTKKDAQPVNL